MNWNAQKNSKKRKKGPQDKLKSGNDCGGSKKLLVDFGPNFQTIFQQFTLHSLSAIIKRHFFVKQLEEQQASSNSCWPTPNMANTHTHLARFDCIRVVGSW